MENSILSFIHEAEKLKSVLRHNWTRTGRQESSAEHSWRMALFFFLVYEAFKLKADPYKTLKMIIIHDLPEITHGDIPGFMKDVDSKKHAEHKRREKQAAREVFAKLPPGIGGEMLKLFNEFEEGKTPEAKLAKAIDKLESQIQHIDSGPAFWSDEERGHHMLNYPVAAVNSLNDVHISRLWDLAKAEMVKMGYELKKNNGK